jgi:hypothetical protein
MFLFYLRIIIHICPYLVKAMETNDKTLCYTIKGMMAGFIFLPDLHRAGLLPFKYSIARNSSKLNSVTPA